MQGTDQLELDGVVMAAAVDLADKNHLNAVEFPQQFLETDGALGLGDDDGIHGEAFF
ncbi:MAG: hypothetical protein WBG37_16240 [Desulfobacterales bacterium]